ncbi:MAG: hypothetical protein HFJ80_07765 [Clostridiales bacterium]|nr:hypothetical protein [Clostridiales bacterium]
MKRRSALVLVLVLMATLFSGCEVSDAPPASEAGSVSAAPVNAEVFRLSGIEDVTDEKGVRSYAMAAPYTDSYTFTSADTKEIAVFDGNQKVTAGEKEVAADLTEGKTYTIQVVTEKANTLFSLKAVAAEHEVTLPYDTVKAPEGTKLTAAGEATRIEYQKREGGTYIYSNNPEQVPASDVGKAYIRNEGLTGNVFFTFEHANYSGESFYLGYQLKNDGEEDVFITVENVGYQAGGTWFGLFAWADFYNTHYTLPDGYLINGNIAPEYSGYDYAYADYIPRVYQPTTYRLPAGEYFYVIGGTTEDAYNGINVDKSANKPLGHIRCANGAVKFSVTGGSVTGTFYCYDDVAQVQAEPVAQGYVVSRGGKDYSPQYIGKADHAGVIDGFFSFTFDDSTKKGRLPVTYTNRYADKLPTKAAPYQAYDSTDHEVKRAQQWMTHLNPQNNHSAVGMDMVNFTCTNARGEETVVDNDHADGGGNPANTANWMIEYQEHYILTNEGDSARTVSLAEKDHGSLFIVVRDENGDVLDTAVTIGQTKSSGSDYVYEVTVEPHTTQTVTLSYVLAPCSYGSVNHFVSLLD